MRRTAVSALACVASLAGAEPAARTFSGMLVGASGMALDTFDSGEAGSSESNCGGPFLGLCPSIIASVDVLPEGEPGIATRDHGVTQRAQQRRPIDAFVVEERAGDAAGDNVTGVWRFAG